VTASVWVIVPTIPKYSGSRKAFADRLGIAVSSLGLIIWPIMAFDTMKSLALNWIGKEL